MQLRYSLIALSFMMTSGRASAANKPLTAEEIRQRLEIQADVFGFDATGKKLEFAPTQKNIWRGSGNSPIESNWVSDWHEAGAIYMHNTWTVQDDATIKVTIEEYAGEDNDSKSRKVTKFIHLLKRSETVLENFAPITWVSQNNPEKHLVVRLTPRLVDTVAVRDFADLPISGVNVVITDNQGFAWATDNTFSGNYVGLTTHRGTVAMSFRPFKGATLVGQAHGKEMSLKLTKDLKIKIRSDSDFLPADIGANVYALFIEGKRNDGPHSVHTFTSSDEARLLTALER